MVSADRGGWPLRNGDERETRAANGMATATAGYTPARGRPFSADLLAAGRAVTLPG
jgi:hypothetical protein